MVMYFKVTSELWIKELIMTRKIGLEESTNRLGSGCIGKDPVLRYKFLLMACLSYIFTIIDMQIHIY